MESTNQNYLFFSASKNQISDFLSFSVFACLFVSFLLTPAQLRASPPEHANSSESFEKANRQKWNAETSARGRILVMPRAGLPAKALAHILKEHKGKAKKIGQSDLYIVDIPEYSEESVITALNQHPYLKYVEPDYIFYSSLTPNDPYFGGAWHLSKTEAAAAWDLSQGAGITIAILDTGVDSTHPDLAGKIVPGWNFYDNNSSTVDVNGHGTAVAGAAAASSNNGVGVTAMAGQSKIMPVRIASPEATAYGSTIAQGLTWAADQGVRVANISYANVPASSTIINAAQYMKNKGGLVIVAAGNGGKDEGFTPTTSMIPVSATNATDNKTSWSSFGNYVALSAPGIDIWTTYRNSLYGTAWGTSLASPVVAGTVALMMAANTKLGSTEIESLLFSTAKDLGSAGRDPYYGYGRVNAAAAVQAAKSNITATDTTPPIVSIIEPLSGETVSGIIPVDIQASDNVGVVRAELWVNNTSVAVDTSEPFAFAWDSAGAPNGEANLVVRAYDAAGNMSLSNTISATVNNLVQSPIVDTEAPVVNIINPLTANVSGAVTITANASDNNGASGITLSIYIDGALKTTGIGSVLSMSWNTRSKYVKAGMHTIKAIAKDAAGNSSAKSVSVNVIK